MFESILKRPSALARHRRAPLLEERTSFLDHLLKQGTSRRCVRAVAARLLHVIKLLNLKKPGSVSVQDVHIAADKWAQQQRRHLHLGTAQYSRAHFFFVAKKWLRFLGRLEAPAHSDLAFRTELAGFAIFMTDQKGLSQRTVSSYAWFVTKFLAWLANQTRPLSAATVEDVYDFMRLKGETGWSRWALASAACALRAFFCHAEAQHWCKAIVSKFIQGPRIYKDEGLPESPAWGDVKRLIESVHRDKPSDLRARAALLLLSIYGLRSGEVKNLLLDDFDWRAERFLVRRSKRAGFDQYPLLREVGDAILDYLKDGRPRCSCRSLFITLRPPYRPISTSALWCITSSRVQKLEIHCRRRGPSILRHACATNLLAQGLSFKEIADYLGHRATGSVEIYAKVDLKSLYLVADLDLGDLI